MVTGSLPELSSPALRASRLSRNELDGRTHISLPERSSTVARAGPAGPVTTISLTPVIVGTEKSTIFLRSSVMVSAPIAMSPYPSARRSSKSARVTGRITISIGSEPVLYFWLRCFWKSWSAS
jgi:hypothetical protein